MVASKTTSSITVKLTDHVSQLLAERVKATGQNLDEYVGNVLEKDLSRPKLNDILAPVQKVFEESGVTDEELDDLVEQAREARYRELHGKPSKAT